MTFKGNIHSSLAAARRVAGPESIWTTRSYAQARFRVNTTSQGIRNDLEGVYAGGIAYGSGLPILTLVPFSPGQLHLSWSTNYPAFALESAATLSAVWQSVTNSTGISGERHTLNMDASGTSQFFRLRKN